MDDAVKSFVSTTFKYNFKSPRARKIQLPELDKDQFKRKSKTPSAADLISPKRGPVMLSPLKDSFASPSNYSTIQTNNVKKWIRDRDIAKIVGKNPRIIDPRKDEDDLHLDERKEISVALTNLRKKYDDVKEKTMKKETEIAQMRESIEKMKEEANRINQSTEGLKAQFEELQKGFQVRKQMYEGAELMSDSYQHMYDRMRHDKLVYQTKLAHIDEALEYRNQELSVVVDEAKKAEQSQLQSKIYLNTLITSIEHEKKKREESLVVFKNAIRNRQEAELQREERIRRTQEIAETAAQEQGSANERKWRKLLLVHKFLSQFLKGKMEREMGKYRAVEQAYQKIKAQTGISDAREIVSRFANREQTYSELLISIADYERKIDSHKKENEELNSKMNALKSMLMQPVMGKTMIGTFNIKEDIQEMEKELQQATQQYKNYRLINDKLYSWSVKMLKKFDKFQSVHGGNYYEQYKRDDVVEPFLAVVQKCKEYIDNIPPEEAEQTLEEIERTKITDEIADQEYLQKNNRVKPLVQNVGSDHPVFDRKDTFETEKSVTVRDYTEVPAVEEDEADDVEDEAAELENMRKQFKKQKDL